MRPATSEAASVVLHESSDGRLFLEREADGRVLLDVEELQETFSELARGLLEGEPDTLPMLGREFIGAGATAVWDDDGSLLAVRSFTTRPIARYQNGLVTRLPQSVEALPYSAAARRCLAADM